LSLLKGDKSLTGIPDLNCWGLVGSGDDFLELNDWDPRRELQDVYRVMALPAMSSPDMGNSLRLQWAALRGDSWNTGARTIKLPSQEIFEIQGSHLVVVIWYRVNVRASFKGKKRTETREEIHDSVLIPANMKMTDLVKAFENISGMSRRVSALYKMRDTENDMRESDRTATELGWKHGTQLVLEMM
jgi:hypothetical protein